MENYNEQDDPFIGIVTGIAFGLLILVCLFTY